MRGRNVFGLGGVVEDVEEAGVGGVADGAPSIHDRVRAARLDRVWLPTRQAWICSRHLRCVGEVVVGLA